MKFLINLLFDRHIFYKVVSLLFRIYTSVFSSLSSDRLLGEDLQGKSEGDSLKRRVRSDSVGVPVLISVEDESGSDEAYFSDAPAEQLSSEKDCDVTFSEFLPSLVDGAGVF